jgi:Zn-dependent peptidase ImmA (M78 family)
MSVTHEAKANVTPSVLLWGINRAETSPQNLAKAAHTSERVVALWLEGERQPSFRQAQEIAKHLRLPFGFLFLREPPPESLPIPDFRTLSGEAVGIVSADLRDVVLATLRRQSWLSDYLKEEGEEPVTVVGRASDATSADAIAADIRKALALNGRPNRDDDFLRDLTASVEGLGVYVIRSGVVGNNTKRRLNVEEFRGFCISDDYAPFIFVNAADAKLAQAFTLIHELAHVWLGDSGVSGPITNHPTGREALCNRVAAEVLVPAVELAEMWAPGADLGAVVANAARRFRVSRYVVAIKAAEMGLITQQDKDALLLQYRREERTATPGESGGDFYRTAVVRNSRRFTERLLDALSRQRVLTRDAAGLLEMGPKNLNRLGRELGGDG